MIPNNNQQKPPIIHHLTWMAREVVKFTGIPVAYSETIAWFAERMILGTLCLLIAGFAAGVIFTVYLSEPIVESQTYNYLADRASVAKVQIIDLTSPVFKQLLVENYVAKVIQTNKRKAQIKEYLSNKNSPFAEDDAALTALAHAKNMKLILAISFVESNFGQHCYYHNCSGIGGSVPNLKKYESYAAWVADFDNLLDVRYHGLSIDKFVGLYVQPGSPNWLYGVQRVLREFKEQGIV
jgi:hypothetical protein